MLTRNHLFRFLFVSILGTLLHFTYKWSGGSPIVALFSAVNESTWEHLKLLFFPMLLLTLLELALEMRRTGGKLTPEAFHTAKLLPKNFLMARTIGILAGMFLIIVVFYTLLGTLGKNYDFLNIALYFAAVIFSFWVEDKVRSKLPHPYFKTAVILLSVLTIAFFLFTFFPPAIGLFADPLIAKPNA